MFTGGAFSQASVLALGIMPYICFIVVQLMGIAIPYFAKSCKVMVEGRKINQITVG
jgi:preprotein translocase subunit SecY